MVARAQPLSPLHKMLLQTSISPPPLQLPFGSLRLRSHRLSIQAVVQCCSEPIHTTSRMGNPLKIIGIPKLQIFQGKMEKDSLTSTDFKKWSKSLMIVEDKVAMKKPLVWLSALTLGQTSCLVSAQASEEIKLNAVFETGELFELGIQLSYLLLLLALLGAGSFFVIRQVLVRRELDLSAKELQEQVRSGDASATELFELGAVMLRRKFYPAATKYLLQAIDKWDGDDQDLAQVYNALGVSYVRDEKVDKGIAQFEKAVKIQPGYVTAWNNLGDALEKKKDYTAALKAFEEVLLFDPNNQIGRPRRDALKDQVEMYKGVSVKSKDPVKSKQK